MVKSSLRTRGQSSIPRAPGAVAVVILQVRLVPTISSGAWCYLAPGRAGSCSRHGEPNPGLSDFSGPPLGPVTFLHSFIPSTQTNVFYLKSVLNYILAAKKKNRCMYIQKAKKSERHTCHCAYGLAP